MKKIFIDGSKELIEKNPELLLIDFKHENILRYFDHFNDKDFLYVVFDYCEVYTEPHLKYILNFLRIL